LTLTGFSAQIFSSGGTVLLLYNVLKSAGEFKVARGKKKITPLVNKHRNILTSAHTSSERPVRVRTQQISEALCQEEFQNLIRLGWRVNRLRVAFRTQVHLLCSGIKEWLLLH